MTAIQARLDIEEMSRRWWDIASGVLAVTIAEENGGIWWSDGAIAEWMPVDHLPSDVAVTHNDALLGRVAEARTMGETALPAQIAAPDLLPGLEVSHSHYIVRSAEASLFVQARYLAYLIERGYDLRLPRVRLDNWKAPPVLGYLGDELRAIAMPVVR